MQLAGPAFDLATPWPLALGKQEAPAPPPEPEVPGHKPSAFAQELSKWAPTKAQALPPEALGESPGLGGLAEGLASAWWRPSLELEPKLPLAPGWRPSPALPPLQGAPGEPQGELALAIEEAPQAAPGPRASGAPWPEATSGVGPRPWGPAPGEEEEAWLRLPGVASVQSSVRQAPEGPLLSLAFDIQSPVHGAVQLQVHHQQGQVALELLAPHSEGVQALQQRLEDMAALLRHHGLVPTHLKVTQMASGQSGRGASFSGSDGRQGFGTLRRPRGTKDEALEAEALA